MSIQNVRFTGLHNLVIVSMRLCSSYIWLLRLFCQNRTCSQHGDVSVKWEIREIQKRTKSDGNRERKSKIKYNYMSFNVPMDWTLRMGIQAIYTFDRSPYPSNIFLGMSSYAAIHMQYDRSQLPNRLTSANSS